MSILSLLSCPPRVALVVLGMSLAMDGLAAPATARQKRLDENRATVERNIATLREGLGTIRENLATVRSELEELEQLEKEHVELKTKFEGVRTKLEAEMAKNREALAALGHREAGPGKNGRTAASDTTTADVSPDVKQRLEWRTDAEAKHAKVLKQLTEIERNLRDIRAQLNPLRSTMQNLTSRERDYDERIKALEAKKSRLEAALVQPSETAPQQASPKD